MYFLKIITLNVIFQLLIYEILAKRNASSSFLRDKKYKKISIFDFS